MSRRVLVIYASRYGQTEKVAHRIAEVAKREGIGCEVAEVADACTPEDFSDVVIAGSVYLGRHAKSLSRYVRQNLPTLARRHTAFATVCMEVEHAPAFVERFLNRTKWAPDATAVFAGGIPYTRYGWFVRFIARRAAAQHGNGNDTSRDYDYTDWHGVDTFAQNFLAEVKAVAA